MTTSFVTVADPLSTGVPTLSETVTSILIPPKKLSVGMIISFMESRLYTAGVSCSIRATKFVSNCSSMIFSESWLIRISPESSSNKNLEIGFSIRRYPLLSSNENAKKFDSYIISETDDATEICILGCETISYVPNIFVPATCRTFCTTSR